MSFGCYLPLSKIFFRLVFVWSLFYQIKTAMPTLAIKIACFLCPFAWEYLLPFFYPEGMSILDVEVCFLDVVEGWILVFPSILLVRVFLLGNWVHWCWEIQMSGVCWFLLFCCCGSGGVCVCFPFFDLMIWNYSLWVIFGGVWLTSLGWSFPTGTFCRAGFVDRYYLHLILSWNVFIFCIYFDWTFCWV